MRDALLTAIGTALLAIDTDIKLATERPWLQNGLSLYVKNMRRIYVADPEVIHDDLIPVFAGADVGRTETTCRAYFSVDAKTPPKNLDLVIDAMLACADDLDWFRYDITSEYTYEIDEDRMIYEFTYTSESTRY